METTIINYYLYFCRSIFIVSAVIFGIGLLVVFSKHDICRLFKDSSSIQGHKGNNSDNIEPKTPYRSLSYIYISLFIMALYIELQIIIAAFLTITISLGWFCFILAQCLTTDSEMNRLIKDVEFGISGNVSHVIETIRVEPWGAYAMAILFLVSLIVAIISMQKVIKFIIIHCNLFFDSWKLSSMIVLSEELKTNKIINQLEELSANVNNRNSIGILGTILRHIDD